MVESLLLKVKMQLKPAWKWCSCHTEHDGRSTDAMNYQRLLDPSKGFHLKIYRNYAAESITLSTYVVQDVDLD